nr:IDM [Cloning vector pIDMv5]
MDHHHHHL